MYYRLMNEFDLQELRASGVEIEEPVWKEMFDLTHTIDTAYGALRRPSDMGGYVLFFPDRESFATCREPLMDYYGLNEEYAEIDEDICMAGNDQNLAWHKQLYLLTSDDALVLVYPEVRTDER